MNIYLDADGTPVLKIVSEIAQAKNISLTIVKNYSIQLEVPYGEIVNVDISADAADLYIVNRLKAGDLVITADRGLSAYCLAKKAYVMDFNGLFITENNINSFLDLRYLNKKMREQGVYSKNKKRLPKDNHTFAHALKHFLEANSEN